MASATPLQMPKLVTRYARDGYWIDTSRVGVKPCTKIRFTSKLLDKPLLREKLKNILCGEN